MAGAAADPVMFIDVHTGLGPHGIDTMLSEGGAETSALVQQASSAV